MNLKERLKIERIADTRFHENGILKFNMSIKEIYDMLQPELFGFFSELDKQDIRIDAPILASAKDIQDYKELESTETGPLMEYNDYEHGLVNILCNLVYYEEEFVDGLTNKHGIKDYFGNVIVPALFDSCKPHRDIAFIDTLNVVEQNGQKWLVSRDGSGRIINDEGFDEISCSYCYGWTRRGNKYGMLDSRTGETLVPCEMDWINDDHRAGMTSLLCRDGKLGLVEFYPKDMRYYEPTYDAIDLATWMVMKNGQWGWVNREGLFSINPPKSRYDIIMFCWDIERYLGEKPKKPGEKDWFTMEELEESLKGEEKMFDAVMEVKPADARILPTMEIPDVFSCYHRLKQKIHRTLSVSHFSCNQLIISPGNTSDAPEMTVTVDKYEISVEWQPRTKKLAWRDAESPLLKSCNQIITAGTGSYTIIFRKTFSVESLDDAVKFIAYYYATVWGINETCIDINPK